MSYPTINTARQIKVNLIGGVQGQTTGLSRYARSLQAALSKAGLEADFVPTRLPALPNSIYKGARKAGFDLQTFFTTYPIALAKETDKNAVLHLTSQNQASAIAFSSHPRTVVTVHDLITSIYAGNKELGGYLKVYDRVFDQLALRGLKKATFLIADSEQTRLDIIKFTGYPSERIRVVPLGIDHSQFRPIELPTEFLFRYNLRTSTPYVLYVGSEDPRKNLRRLLEAFAGLSKVRPEVRLLKVGAARFEQERRDLTSFIERLGLKEKVLFFDQVSDKDLTYFYNIAQVFVFPSLYEGFGLPPLEAMACGTPVISSNASSLPEVIGEAGLIVNPLDVEEMSRAIEQVLGNRQLQSDLRKRGFDQAARFTWEKTAQQTLEVYRQIFEEVN